MINKTQRGSVDGEMVVGITWILLAVVSIAAWFTHVITCFTEEAWGFLIAGAIMVPVAVIHGIGIWFGAF